MKLWEMIVKKNKNTNMNNQPTISFYFNFDMIHSFKLDILCYAKWEWSNEEKVLSGYFKFWKWASKSKSSPYTDLFSPLSELEMSIWIPSALFYLIKINSYPLSSNTLLPLTVGVPLLIVLNSGVSIPGLSTLNLDELKYVEDDESLLRIDLLSGGLCLVTAAT